MNAFSVRLIIDSVNRQWIIGKMAERLADGLKAIGISTDIGEGPRDDVDVNHWMLYLQPWRHYYSAPGFFGSGWRPAPTKHTAMITHVDDPLKVQIIRDSIPKILDLGICMSRMTREELIGQGIGVDRLTWINPAHDAAVEPRRIVIGLTTRVYGDARKNADWLIDVSRRIRLDAFRFEFIGSGWEEVGEHLRSAGAVVDLAPADHDYAYIVRRLPQFDYYLYMGFDEGSMGTLDALAAGVKTIVTPQGFHLDLPGGITHPICSAADLAAVLSSIAEERQRRIDGVKNLTWREYARRHQAVWRALLDGRPIAHPEVSAAAVTSSADLAAARRRRRSRLFRSEFWPFFVESRKFWARGKLSRIKRWFFHRRS